METLLGRKIEKVRIDSLIPFPGNARRGDVDGIAESLALGQFRPLLVQTSTRHIMAGNHTAQAAEKLEWTHIDVVFLDVDDATASRINIADNRYSDLAIFDQILVKDQLAALPTLDGSGFSRLDFDALNAPLPPAQGPPVVGSEVNVSIGTVSFHVPRAIYDEWAAELASEVGKDPDDQATAVRNRLGL